jgi:hypothetical protein
VLPLLLGRPGNIGENVAIFEQVIVALASSIVMLKTRCLLFECGHLRAGHVAKGRGSALLGKPARSTHPRPHGARTRLPHSKYGTCRPSSPHGPCALPLRPTHTRQGARHVAKDLAGRGMSNPTATLLSTAMMLRHMRLAGEARGSKGFQKP